MKATQLNDVMNWPRLEPDLAAMLIKAMLIKDVNGQLTQLLLLHEWACGPVWTANAPQHIYAQTLNWLVFASAVWIMR